MVSNDTKKRLAPLLMFLGTMITLLCVTAVAMWYTGLVGPYIAWDRVFLIMCAGTDLLYQSMKWSRLPVHATPSYVRTIRELCEEP